MSQNTGPPKRRIPDSPEGASERSRRPFSTNEPLSSTAGSSSSSASRPPLSASNRTTSTAVAPPTSTPKDVTENALRPDRGGTVGKATRVFANFFAIQRLPTSKIFHYDVSIAPELPPDRARKLWSIVEAQPEFARENVKIAFDGRANAFSASKIKRVSDAGDALALELELPEERGRNRGPDAKKNIFKLKLLFVAEINVNELQLFLDRRGPFTAGCSTAIQALNVVLTHKPFTTMANVGRSVYIPDNAVNLGGGIEKWEGIFQSVRPGQRTCYVNIDTTATAFIKGGNAVDVIGNILGRFDPNRSLHRNDIAKIERVLKGCTFTVVTRSDSQRRYKIANVSQAAADRTYFDRDFNDGSKRSVSVSDYFFQTYDRRLKYPALPCLGAKGRESVAYFPAEVCFITPGQHYKKKLNDEQLAAMIKTTAIKPDQRASKIRNSLRILDMDANPYLASFGIRISPEMSVVPARVLPPPTIEFGGQKQDRPNQGAWQIHRDRQFKQRMRLDCWGLLVFEKENSVSRYLGTFVRMLYEVMCNVGMNVTNATPPIVYAQLGGDVPKEVENARRRAEAVSKSPMQLLIVLLPGKGQIYPQIKTYCETQGAGLMTQCALLPKLQRVNDQYCRLLVCKINTKLGGVVSALGPDDMPFMDKGDPLVIGADVSHPGPGEDSKPSIAAIVASTDNEAFKFIGRLFVQDPRLEVIESMQSVMGEILLAYKKATGHHPKKILVYRDGVSESQFPEILRTEVLAIVQACAQLDKKYRPRITFVIVKKRHHARFFPQNSQDRDRSGNCVSGTVIDTNITHPTEFNFYLQSHAGLQGTSKSTLYHVLLDENKFTSDTLQQLTYNLCHVYSRCPKAVSIVPAVQYAHLLAFRARYYLDYGYMNSNRPQYGPIRISSDLMNKMFFV
ncbi:Piwi domain-containing protein [Dissophora ornata]|nr:eukaryotic translation initiation factor 2C, 2 [Dissophora ornata]KAI8606615.1 Piwi domain-containing protein [Dissophora ornata]